MSRLILIGLLSVVAGILRKDTASRDGISKAVWIPTLWAAILFSRPISSWVGFGGGNDAMEGSPLDRTFYFGLIFLALFVLFRRNLSWSILISRNWPVFLFYGYCLLSVMWAESPPVSFKRWFKDFGNILMVLMILTEANPSQAFRAVFVRCAYLLIPLSVIFIRYFPNLGRRYSEHSGGMEVVGVTVQKNSLGVLVLVSGLVLIWDCFERPDPDRSHEAKLTKYFPAGVLLMGVYLLRLCDSKTSMLCLALGAGILASSKLPLLRRRIAAIGGYSLLAAVALVLLDWLFGIKEAIVGSLGRDMTFTGRTEVWKELLALDINPLIGTGFYSFWSDKHYQARLPEWVAVSAHNGYLETYIDGGVIGLFFLAVMLLVVALRMNRQLAVSGNHALVCFAALVVTLIGNLSESHFARMTPLWFLFLLSALELQPRRSRSLPSPLRFARVAPKPNARERRQPVSWLRRV